MENFFTIMLRRENKEANFVASGMFWHDCSSVYAGADETQLYARCKYVASTVYLRRAHPSASCPRKQALATKVRRLCSMQRTE